MNIDVPALNRATDSVFALINGFQYSKHMTPDNLGQIREAFVRARGRGQRMNPVFEYVEAPAGFLELLDGASAQLPRDEPWRSLLAAELGSARNSYDVALAHKAAPLTRRSIDIYGRPRPELVEAARELLKTTDEAMPQTDDGVWTARSAGAVLLAAIRHLGIEGWQLEISDRMAAKASINGRKRLVRVRADAIFTTSEMRRLIIHEIGTHVLRSVNAKRGPVNLLSRGIAGSTMTEEGLAVWHERRYGMATAAISRKYALRYLACDAALTEDFCGIVDVLTPHATVADAFDIAVRVKRGMVDTSEPGGYLKDQVYFGGASAVSAHLAETPDDYPLLMASKWPMQQLPVLRQLRDQGYLPPPLHESAAIARFAESIRQPISHHSSGT